MRKWDELDGHPSPSETNKTDNSERVWAKLNKYWQDSIIYLETTLFHEKRMIIPNYQSSVYGDWRILAINLHIGSQLEGRPIYK